MIPMKKLTVTFSLSFMVLFCLAQTKPAPTLLWRISGNGMTKPSFLFGTMHVNERRAFNFKDSLYQYLEQADAFAMEFHPDSANSIITAYMNGELSTDNSQGRELTEEQMKVLEKKLSTLNAKGPKKSKKAMLDYFLGKIMTSEKKEEAMETFMDAFLFDMARRAGKDVIGLEDVKDQVAAFGSLSKGLQTKHFVDLIENWDFTKTGSPIHELYYKEDLDGIDRFFNTYFTQETLNGFLYKRNIVMVRGMDSLMKTKSVFTAVGAGHLPGKEGIIALLRKKGYKVEPVYSSVRLPASSYQFKTAGAKWQSFTIEHHGLHYELPGKPTIQEGAYGRQVTFHYDLAGGMLYMLITGPLNASEKRKKPEDVAKSHLNDMIFRGNALLLSSKPFSKDGFQGLEGLGREKNKAFFRSKEIVTGSMFYLLTVSAQSRENVFNQKAEYFFNTFRNVPVPQKASEWKYMDVQADGFRIRFPHAPRVVPQKMDEDASDRMQVTTYSSFDLNSTVDYTVSAGKTIGGNSYFSDEFFFQTYIQSLKEHMNQEDLEAKDTSINGFPGKLVVSQPFENRMITALIVKRANRNYLLLAEYDTLLKNNKDIQNFFSSFSLIDFPEASWSMQQDGENHFSTWAPAPFITAATDSTNEDPAVNFFTQDPHSSAIYQVSKSSLSKYYWASQVDSIYADWQRSNVNTWQDSILYTKPVRNGNLHGVEIYKFNKSHNTYSRTRMLLSGRTIYTMTANAAPGNTKNHEDRFFNDFKVTREQKGGEGLARNSSLLFNDLRSNDSLVFSKAYDALSDVSFQQEDLLPLVEQSLVPFRYAQSEYISVNSRLLILAQDLMASASEKEQEKIFDLVKTSYTKEDTIIQQLRSDLLALLAHAKNKRSYDLVRELMAKKIPDSDDGYRLFPAFYKNLQLSKDLFPEFLRYMDNRKIGLETISLARTLIDSNLISFDVFQSSKKEFIRIASMWHTWISKESTYYGHSIDIISLLSLYKDREADALIARFLSSKDLDVQQAALIALVKNDHPADAKVLSSLSRNVAYRVGLYEGLKKIGKEKIFPATSRSQKLFAESYIHESIMYEDEYEAEDIQLKFLKRVEAEYKGSTKRFYLFEVSFKEEYDEEEADAPMKKSYLGVAGPFEKDDTKLSIPEKDNISSVHYDDVYRSILADQLFKKFLKAIE
jgi:uncharacterized protein YbaP (TraB family)